jgi:hypothetical protein
MPRRITAWALGEDKLGETIEIAVELTDFTGDPRLMAHLNDCVVDLGLPMVARLRCQVTAMRYRCATQAWAAICTGSHGELSGGV